MRSRAVLRVASGAVLAFNFTLFFLDRTLPEYVDESDNLLGGRLMSTGYRLYTDYFSQHMPVPYYAAAAATLLGARDLIAYRTFFAVLVTAVLGFLLLHFRNRLSSAFLLPLVALIAIGHPIFSGYMVLADHFFAFSLLVLLLFVLSRAASFNLADQILISVCCFVALQSTLISVYPLVLMATYYIVRKLPTGTDLRNEARFGLILLTPHALLLAATAQQGALSSLVQDAVVFNQRYYAAYDIGGDPVSILANSLRDFGLIVVQYLRPSGLREVETVLLVSNIVAVLVSWRTRGPLFGAFYVGFVILSRMRGPGYHGSPYFVVSFASLALVLAYAFEVGSKLVRTGFRRPASDRRLRPIQAVATVALPLGLLVYVAFAALFVHDVAGFYRRLPRGQALDSPYARVVLAATEPSDRIWVAPNGPYVYLQSGRQPASTYSYYQPWQSDSPQIVGAVLRDLQAVQPPIIVYEADKHIEWNFPLPTPAEYGGAVYAYIQSAYTPVSTTDAVLRNVYLRRDRSEYLRAKLSAAGLLSAGT